MDSASAKTASSELPAAKSGEFTIGGDLRVHRLGCHPVRGGSGLPGAVGARDRDLGADLPCAPVAAAVAAGGAGRVADRPAAADLRS